MKYSFREIVYYACVRLPRIILGKFFTHNLVLVHWGRGLNNFGDCMQKDILSHYGLLPVYVPSYGKSDIILEGSVLQLVPENFNGFIVGTGGDCQQYTFADANILSVRGYLTLRNLNPRPANIGLGDPGLLARLVYKPATHKKYKLGIVLHFVDSGNNAVLRIYEANKGEVALISVLQKPSEVIRQITECDFIISSSLHGLVVADSFNIPNRRWVDRTTMDNVDFHDYKFKDYYSIFNRIESPICLSGNETLSHIISLVIPPPTGLINERISHLDKIMADVSKRIKKELH